MSRNLLPVEAGVFVPDLLNVDFVGSTAIVATVGAFAVEDLPGLGFVFTGLVFFESGAVELGAGDFDVVGFDATVVEVRFDLDRVLALDANADTKRTNPTAMTSVPNSPIFRAR
jgi:hypothetical protein